MPADITVEQAEQLAWLRTIPNNAAPEEMLLSLPHGRRNCIKCGFTWSVWELAVWNSEGRCPKCGCWHDRRGEEIFQDALRFAHMWSGTIGIDGEEGAGKTMFICMVLDRMATYFNKTIMASSIQLTEQFKHKCDNADFTVLVKELIKAGLLAKKGTWDDEKIGKCKLKGVAWGVDEIHDWVYNRRPGKTEGILLGKYLKLHRHFDALTIGGAPATNELDDKLWNNRCTHICTASLDKTRPGWSSVTVFNKRMGRITNVFHMEHARWGKMFVSKNPVALLSDELVISKGKGGGGLDEIAAEMARAGDADGEIKVVKKVKIKI